MTVFEHICRLKEAGFWRAELSMYHRATTLDFYYRLYALIRELAPERGYGYLHRLLKNERILKLIDKEGGQRDVQTLKWAITEMEAPVYD